MWLFHSLFFGHRKESQQTKGHQAVVTFHTNLRKRAMVKHDCGSDS